MQSITQVAALAHDLAQRERRAVLQPLISGELTDTFPGRKIGGDFFGDGIESSVMSVNLLKYFRVITAIFDHPRSGSTKR
ncbi:hypothetical protein [Pseudomonas fluorescens]|uniref:hypothetical protein n=1 Tax=Pseudomonas fluorescens TaxID=294 RepID=UPI0029661F0D|nr:hypothetical protein [Pseudomonas fluorescens]